MEGLTPRSVRATIHYSRQTDRRPMIDNSDFSRNVMSLVPAEVIISDAGAFATPARLDVEGFVRVPHRTDLSGLDREPKYEPEQKTDFANFDEKHTRDYRAALTQMMLELTAADEVITMKICPVRRQKPVVPGSDATVGFVHSDYSPLVDPKDTQREYAGCFRPARPIRRTAQFNLWRLLSRGPTNRPLALCDASSVTLDDVIPGDTVFPDGSSFETCFVQASSRHRWAYYPDLTSDEILVFKQTDTDRNHSRFTPHVAFDDTSCAADAQPRVSIESRCLAVWYA